jgi:uncharacterized protein (TIGR00297 family)
MVDALGPVISSRAPGLGPALLANSSVFVFGLPVLLKGLTGIATANAWFLGTAVFAAFGFRGYLLVCLYFILGSAVTKIKLEQKEREGTAEANSGRRNVGSVWGSGSAGVLCALLALAYPEYDSILRLGFVASFCSKLSDTTASEVGKAYGKTTYNSLPPFNPVPRGTEGAVSLEGTLAGVAASFVFAGVAALLGELNTATSSPLLAAAVCAFAAFVATTFESALGSMMQGRKGWEWLTNDVVNGIQIAIAAIIAILLGIALN